MEAQKSIVAVRQQDVLNSLWRQRSWADRSGMVLGVVCGLRKEYTTLGIWLKAWVRSTFIWFLTPTCSYTATGRAIFTDLVHLKCSLYLCFTIVYIIYLPQYSVYNLVSLCILLDNICFAEQWPDATRMNLFINLLISNWNLCSKRRIIFILIRCVFLSPVRCYL